jgi:hypothetical protein
MSDPQTPPGNPVDEALLKLVGDLAGLAKAALPARGDADDASKALVAQLLGVSPGELMDSPEKTTAGVMNLVGQLQAFVQGAVSDDPKARAQGDAARALFETTLTAHGRDASGPIDQASRALRALSGKDDRLDQRALVGGLRKMADAFEGKAVEGDPSQLEQLKEALQTIGRDLTGVDPEREAKEREAELRAHAASDIDDVFKGLGLS